MDKLIDFFMFIGTTQLIIGLIGLAYNVLHDPNFSKIKYHLYSTIFIVNGLQFFIIMFVLIQISK